MRERWNGFFAASLGAVLSVAASSDARAEEKLQFDHGSGELRFRGKEVKDGQAVRVPAGAEVRVEVTNTNTALFTFELVSEQSDAEDAKALRQFLATTKPYLPDVFVLGLPRPEYHAFMPEHEIGVAASDVETIAADVQRILEQVDAGLAALRFQRTRSAQALEDMARKPGETRRVADELCRALGAPQAAGEPRPPGASPTDCVVPQPLESVRRLRGALESFEREYPRLIEAAQALRRQLAVSRRGGAPASKGSKGAEASKGAKERLEALEKEIAPTEAAAKRLASELGKVVSEANDLQYVATAAASARSTWSASRALPLKWDKEQRLTLKVTPRKDLADGAPARTAAEQPGSERRTSHVVIARVVPEWPVRVAVGLSLMVAPRATYPTYGTRTVDPQVEVFRKGETDARALYAVTLGATPAWLDWRDRNGVALWPELSFAPADPRAVAVGLALSWRILKLGVGAMWARHERLDGLSEGELLPDETYLRTRQTYGGGANPYVSVSLFASPPFVP